MSSRDALRKLTKKFPAPPELESILAALGDGPDLTTAIVGTALIEAGLERVLLVSFKSKAPSLPGKLFENQGPLSDFNSKILIAEAFGVISGEMASELHGLRRIRNAFAHARMRVSFDTPEIHNEVQNFLMMKAFKATDEKRPSLIFKLSELSDRDAFLVVLNFVFAQLDVWHRRWGGDPLLVPPRSLPEKSPR